MCRRSLCPGPALAPLEPPGEGHGAGAVLVLTQMAQVLHRGAATSDFRAAGCVSEGVKPLGALPEPTACRTPHLYTIEHTQAGTPSRFLAVWGSGDPMPWTGVN